MLLLLSSEFNWTIYRFHDFQNTLVHEKDKEILHANTTLHKKKRTSLLVLHLTRPSLTGNLGNCPKCTK